MVLNFPKSFRIKSFVEANAWGLFKSGQSIFKKNEKVDCYVPLGFNKNILL